MKKPFLHGNDLPVLLFWSVVLLILYMIFFNGCIGVDADTTGINNIDTINKKTEIVCNEISGKFIYDDSFYEYIVELVNYDTCQGSGYFMAFDKDGIDDINYGNPLQPANIFRKTLTEYKLTNDSLIFYKSDYEYDIELSIWKYRKISENAISIYFYNKWITLTQLN